mmetsp:Transcript_81483/g.221046  ORF Transcript_81483/g.221046 Transcript_81483/m.221046 type:complete len:224 (-) Transcript_81483:274-945(-)
MSLTSSTVWYLGLETTYLRKTPPMTKVTTKPPTAVKNAVKMTQGSDLESMNVSAAELPMTLPATVDASKGLEAAPCFGTNLPSKVTPKPGGGPAMSASDWHSARSAPLQSRTQARSTIRFARGAWPPWDGWLSMYSSAVMFVVVISISTAYSSSGMFTHLSMMYQSKFWKQPMVKGDTCMRLAVTARGSSKIFDRSSVTTGRASAARAGAGAMAATAVMLSQK